MELNEAVKIENLLKLFNEQGIDELLNLPLKYGKKSINIPENVWDKLYDVIEDYYSQKLTGGTDEYSLEQFMQESNIMNLFARRFICTIN